MRVASPPQNFSNFKQKILVGLRRGQQNDNHWHNVRIKFILAVTAGALMFLLVFLADLSYLYGSLYQDNYRYHNFHYLVVDYDGGAIGQAFQATYNATASLNMPTAFFHSPSEYPNTHDVYQAVWNGDYAFAVSISQGASDRLNAALQGGEAAATYDPTQVITWIWNQQNFPTFQQSITKASFQSLFGQVFGFYNKLNPRALHSLNQSDPRAIQAFLRPIGYTETNIKPTPQGSVVLLTTASMAMPVLQQFFFLLILNAVCGKFQLYSHVPIRKSTVVRFTAGIIYALGAALAMSGYYFAFRESWTVNAAQFFLTWATLWLLMHIHFLIFDTLMALLPLPFMPFLVLTWIFVNIAGTVSPLSIQPDFYHWATILPAHNTILTLFTIWSGGANNRLYRTLPLLFSWWIVSNVTSVLAHRRACTVAKRKKEEQGDRPREENPLHKEEAEDIEATQDRPKSDSSIFAGADSTGKQTCAGEKQETQP
ncbi:MAG: hypothetical protein M1820_006571 [Bogoriella megaspora]|nr:MAG: hypothetical protein M1820_006571 [Bogoriella megaspora]